MLPNVRIQCKMGSLRLQQGASQVVEGCDEVQMWRVSAKICQQPTKSGPSAWTLEVVRT
jgi:hypothetical protein